MQPLSGLNDLSICSRGSRLPPVNPGLSDGTPSAFLRVSGGNDTFPVGSGGRYLARFGEPERALQRKLWVKDGGFLGIQCPGVRREGGFKPRLTHNFLVPPVCLLRRNGPVPGILAGRREGKIVNKSERPLSIGVFSAQARKNGGWPIRADRVNQPPPCVI